MATEPGVVELGAGDRGAVDLGFQHLDHHGSYSSGRHVIAGFPVSRRRSKRASGEFLFGFGSDDRAVRGPDFGRMAVLVDLAQIVVDHQIGGAAIEQVPDPGRALGRIGGRW